MNVTEPTRLPELSVMLWPLPGRMDEKLNLAATAHFRAVGFTSEPSRWTSAERREVRRFLLAHELRPIVMSAVPRLSTRTPSMLVPDHRRDLLRELRRSIGVAHELEIVTLILMTGEFVSDVPRETQLRRLTETCRWCAELAEQAKVTFVLEPLNTATDHPGYFLTDAREALQVVREVDSPHLRILFDCYHQQAQHGDAVEVIADALPWTAVVHVADHPGRHEPGSGTIEWTRVAAALKERQFDGELSFEFIPRGDVVESLDRSRELLISRLRT